VETFADAKRKRALRQKKTSDSSSSEAGVYAALDLGTNNCRLLIASPVYSEGEIWPALRILDSYSRIVRLGEGLSKHGSLSEDAMQRTAKALKVCRQKLVKHPKATVRFVATEACRRAGNASTFLRQIAADVGMDIEIITNEEEARLAFYGCSSLLGSHARKALTFDIGGGSTEFMWARREDPTQLPEILGWNSIPYGVMNLSEQFGGTAFTEMYFDEIVEKLAKLLRQFDEKHHIRATIAEEGSAVQLLSTSGTVTTLAAIHLGLNRYDRSKVDGICLRMADLRGAIALLMDMTPTERYQHPCIGSQRADYIIGGCAILEAIHQVWPLDHITIADRGVREGIIMGLLLGNQQGAEA
jgi:exopolyphosphatase / guanosine-5'-triphosphate,3'-diphosphate pyrophosphatase